MANDYRQGEELKLDSFLRDNKQRLIVAFFAFVLAISYSFYFFKITSMGGTAKSIIAMGVFSVLAFLSFFAFAKAKKASFEALSAVTIFTLGLIFIISWGPFKMADEPGHYIAAYRYSNALLATDGFSESVPMREDDKDFYLFWADDTRSPQNDTDEIKQGFSLFCGNSSVAQLDEGYLFSVFRRPPQMHLVPALGLTIGRLLNLGATPTYYLARLLSLVIFSLVSYLALRLLPRYKLSTLVLLLLPITLEIATSFSYDTPIIEVAFLLFALCMHYRHAATPIKPSGLILISLLVILLCPMKTIYCLLAIFVFILPSYCFNNRRIECGYKACVALLIVLSFVLINFASVSSLAENTTAGFNSSGYPTSPDYAPSYTLAMALDDPAHALNLLASTFFNNSSRHIQGLFGGLMSWTNITGPWYIVIAFFTLFAYAIYTEKRDKTITPSIRILLLLLFGIGSLAIYASLMIGWISVNEIVIVGIQGRYFIPLLPLLIVALSGLSKNQNQPKDYVFLGTLLFINLYYCGWILTSIATA